MSSAFTTPVTLRDCHKIGDVISETALAFRERLEIARWTNMSGLHGSCGQPVAGATYQNFANSPGDDPWDSHYDFNSYRTMNRQLGDGGWLEGANGYLDHDESPYGGVHYDSVPRLTLAEVKDRSGMTSGFRRATEWDTSTDDWTDYALSLIHI